MTINRVNLTIRKNCEACFAHDVGGKHIRLYISFLFYIYIYICNFCFFFLSLRIDIFSTCRVQRPFVQAKIRKEEKKAKKKRYLIQTKLETNAKAALLPDDHRYLG